MSTQTQPHTVLHPRAKILNIVVPPVKSCGYLRSQESLRQFTPSVPQGRRENGKPDLPQTHLSLCGRKNNILTGLNLSGSTPF